jgi:tetratricopeptide (TPR) repeat protein
MTRTYLAKPQGINHRGHREHRETDSVQTLDIFCIINLCGVCGSICFFLAGSRPFRLETDFRIILISLLFILTTACGGAKPRPPEPLQTAAEFERRGTEQYAAGDYAGAIRLFERAFEQYGRVDRREPMLRNRIYTAQSALLINDLPHAERALAGLAEMVDYGGGPAQRYRLWLLQSEYLIRSQRYSEAVAPLEHIIAADEPPRQIVDAALLNRAQIALAMGAPDRDYWLQQARAAGAHGGLNQNRLLRLQALTLSATGAYAAAEKLLLLALENYRHALFQPGIAATLGELGQLKQAHNSPEEARFLLRRALTLRLELSDIPSSIELARLLEAVETGTGNAAAAADYANQQKKLESLLTSGNSQL